jgi:hypothetical protein
MLEYWNAGILGFEGNGWVPCSFLKPLFHNSTIPLFHFHESKKPV